MLKILSLLILVLLSSSELFTQEFKALNRPINSYTINSIDKISSDRYFAVGDYGTIYSIENEVVTLLRGDLEFTHLNDLTAINNNIIVVGDNGFLMTSNDFGSNWIEHNQSTSSRLIKISNNGERILVLTKNNIYEYDISSNSLLNFYNSPEELNDIISVQNLFFVVGSNGYLLEIDNDLNVKEIESGTTNNITHIASNGERIIITPEKQSIIYSDDLFQAYNFLENMAPFNNVKAVGIDSKNSLYLVAASSEVGYNYYYKEEGKDRVIGTYPFAVGKSFYIDEEIGFLVGEEATVARISLGVIGNPSSWPGFINMIHALPKPIHISSVFAENNKFILNINKGPTKYIDVDEVETIDFANWKNVTLKNQTQIIYQKIIGNKEILNIFMRTFSSDHPDTLSRRVYITSESNGGVNYIDSSYTYNYYRLSGANVNPIEIDNYILLYVTSTKEILRLNTISQELEILSNSSYVGLHKDGSTLYSYDILTNPFPIYKSEDYGDTWTNTGFFHEDIIRYTVSEGKFLGIKSEGKWGDYNINIINMETGELLYSYKAPRTPKMFSKEGKIILYESDRIIFSLDNGQKWFIKEIPKGLSETISLQNVVLEKGHLFAVDIHYVYYLNLNNIASVILSDSDVPSAYSPYPNPANNMVTLPFDFLSSANLANMEIKLIDVSGRDVSQFADFNIRALNHYKAELEIKLDNIQRGIYFIQMTLNGTNKTSSFIKLN